MSSGAAGDTPRRSESGSERALQTIVPLLDQPIAHSDSVYISADPRRRGPDILDGPVPRGEEPGRRHGRAAAASHVQDTNFPAALYAAAAWARTYVSCEPPLALRE